MKSLHPWRFRQSSSAAEFAHQSDLQCTSFDSVQLANGVLIAARHYRSDFDPTYLTSAGRLLTTPLQTIRLSNQHTRMAQVLLQMQLRTATGGTAPAKFR